MSTIDWKAIAKNAKEKTLADLSTEISSITRLNNAEIEGLIEEVNIDHVKFVEVLEVVKNATLSNEQKAKAIANIDQGIGAVIGLVEKII